MSSRIARQGALACELAEHITNQVLAGRPADQALHHWFRNHKNCGSRDRRFLSSAVFAWMRWAGWSETLAGEHWPHRIALSWKFEHNEPHPVIDALEPGEPYHGNLSLDQKAAVVDQPIAALVPPWVPQELPAADLPLFIAAAQQRLPTWLRIGGERRDEIEADLLTAAPEATRNPHMPDAFGLNDPGLVHRLQQQWKHGVQIQDLASQCVVLAADPKPGQTWWDACCGSGGKTLHLADRLGGVDTLRASDVRESALRAFRKRLPRKLRPNTYDLLQDPNLNQRFDGILVDAPCSGMGTWARNPDARWRTEASFLRNRARQQIRMLQRAADHLAPGGKLVYAVCSVAPRETTAVWDSLLSERSDLAPQTWTLACNTNTITGATTIPPGRYASDGMFIGVATRNAD